jgi:hypothetical protein
MGRFVMLPRKDLISQIVFMDFANTICGFLVFLGGGADFLDQGSKLVS